MKKSYDIIIVGGGSSAGFFLSFLKDKKFFNKPGILIIEKMSKPFKKIRASGNGRCNYSNLNFSKEDYYSFSASDSWKSFMFEKINGFDLKKYLLDQGIPYKYDEYGRVFPYTNSSLTIENYFNICIKDLGVELVCDSEVKEVFQNNDKDYVVKIYDKNNNVTIIVRTKTIIFASGGCSYPQLGTDGSSFNILKKIGHKITKTVAGIVALETEEKFFSSIKGTKIDCGIKYKNFYRTGELLFTDYGISGPNVLYVSNLVSMELTKGKVVLNIDFLPQKYLTLQYYKNLFKNKNDTLEKIFNGSLNLNFIKLFVNKVLCKNYTLKDKINDKILEKIYINLKNYNTTIIGTRTYEESQVTIGGVNCNEIDPVNLESKISKNLFFMGEIIDYTGGCGGYNLHFCSVCGKILAEEMFKKFNN